MAKKAKIATINEDLEKQTLVFNFTHGKTHTVNVGDLDEAILRKLAMHGAKQKLHDAYANADGNSTDGEAMFLAVLDTLQSGQWSSRKPGEKGEEPTGLLAQAVVAAMAKAGQELNLDTVRAKLEAMDKSGRAAFRRNPEIAAELARIRASKSPQSLGDLANSLA